MIPLRHRRLPQLSSTPPDKMEFDPKTRELIVDRKLYTQLTHHSSIPHLGPFELRLSLGRWAMARHYCMILSTTTTGDCPILTSADRRHWWSGPDGERGDRCREGQGGKEHYWEAGDVEVWVAAQPAINVSRPFMALSFSRKQVANISVAW